jgi:CheY-like chemotaxis protein
MESIGRLAGGVAHDFNNLLMVICGNTELMKTDPSLPLRHQEAIAEVLEASRRAQALTQQLLMFSRKQVIRPVPTELNRQIEESLRLYRRLIGEDITLTFSPCLDETPVLADQQQFDQLLGNLLLNARDAIHEQPVNTRVSEIRVSTQLVRVGSPLHAGAPAVRLTVADTGVGMDDETRQNIFEPFFTTKEVGKGTGLGLSTVLGVIQQNHGVIEVESAPGRGSTFHVYWPMHREVAAPVVEEASLLPTTGSEHVLLVEDEDQVRTFMVRGLNRLGFSVTACSSGEHALQMLADGAPPPDVLVTDVVMPRMNGSQLADKVQAHFPGLPVLFVSGYTDDIVAQQGIVREGVELLEKPFSPDTLGRRIRRLLDVRRSA